MYMLYELVRIIVDSLDIKKTDWHLAIDQINVRNKEIQTKTRSKDKEGRILGSPRIGISREAGSQL